MKFPTHQSSLAIQVSELLKRKKKKENRTLWRVCSLAFLLDEKIDCCHGYKTLLSLRDN